MRESARRMHLDVLAQPLESCPSAHSRPCTAHLEVLNQAITSIQDSGTATGAIRGSLLILPCTLYFIVRTLPFWVITFYTMSQYKLLCLKQDSGTIPPSAKADLNYD